MICLLYAGLLPFFAILRRTIGHHSFYGFIHLLDFSQTVNMAQIKLTLLANIIDKENICPPVLSFIGTQGNIV